LIFFLTNQLFFVIFSQKVVEEKLNSPQKKKSKKKSRLDEIFLIQFDFIVLIHASLSHIM